MGRIDRSSGQDAVMERRHICAMLRHFEEYEKVKQKKHLTFSTAQSFYDARGICKQNFLKYYRRYCLSGRDINSLIPHKTGRKFKDVLTYSPEIIEKIKQIRAKGYNRYDLSELIKQELNVFIPPSTMYRLLKKLKINRLNPVIKETKRRIIKMNAGDLGHIDIHYVTKGTVKEPGNKKLYILGLIDSYSRVCDLKIIDSIKAINVSFATMELLLRLHERYEIRFTEMMSDNGSEFSSKNNPDHPFERMLSFYGIKHRYTKPFSPQTNGKIERFWRTLEDELLAGETFETLEEFEHYIRGYVLYYNEHRMHQGIKNKKPAQIINKMEPN